MKKVVYILVCILSFVVGVSTSCIINNIHNKKTLQKYSYNMCVRVLIDEDYILEGCDEYFKNDEWYKNYMNIIFKEYEKLTKEGLR